MHHSNLVLKESILVWQKIRLRNFNNLLKIILSLKKSESLAFLDSSPCFKTSLFHCVCLIIWLKEAKENLYLVMWITSKILLFHAKTILHKIRNVIWLLSLQNLERYLVLVTGQPKSELYVEIDYVLGLCKSNAEFYSEGWGLNVHVCRPACVCMCTWYPIAFRSPELKLQRSASSNCAWHHLIVWPWMNSNASQTQQ